MSASVNVHRNSFASLCTTRLDSTAQRDFCQRNPASKITDLCSKSQDNLLPMMTDVDEQKLNLNQPLLSARRYVASRTISNEKQKADYSSPPRFQSQVKSGPIRNPGAVPFLWELAPGHPKQQMIVISPTDRSKTSDTPAPKPPPGRSPKANQNINMYTSEKQLVDHGGFMEVDESSKEMNEENEGDSEEAYVDALDTLSRTEESFSLSCSTSGLINGTEDRDFVMDRFLPAAKAMASLDTPQYVLTEKQPQIDERSRQLVYQQKPALRYGPSFAMRYSHYQEEEGEEEEDESDDEYGQRQNVCGLLPGFCLRRPHIHSAGFLNRVSANKVQRWADSSKVSGEKNQLRKNELSGFESHNTSTQAHTIHKVKMHNGTCKRFRLGDGKGKFFKTLEEQLTGQCSPKESSLVIEKTLYVDTVTHMLGSLDFGAFPNNTTHNTTHNTDRTNSTISDGSCKKSNTMDLAERRGLFQPDSTAGEVVREAKKEEIEIVENGLLRSFAEQIRSRHPLPPPLPKSPSDSWLWRTLPSLSTKNSLINHRERFSKKPASDDIRWETIVRTPKGQNRHIMRYSEESLTTIPET